MTGPPRAPFEDLLERARRIVSSAAAGRDEVLGRLCRLLAGVPGYDWVGFYIAEPSLRVLVLGPFVGEPTEHRRIPYGSGICGQAAERGETFVVQDVSREGNYLSCSPRVKAEIVVPVYSSRGFAAELDIDSHRAAPFTDADRAFLERIAQLAGRLFDR
jgi:GAF domain-containing protein